MYVGSVFKLRRYVYKKLYFVEKDGMYTISFFEKNSILYQRTYFSESIENFDGWYIYFKIMGFAAV